MTVLPDGASRIFLRNKQRTAGNGKPAQHLRAIVAELDGVRVYVVGTRIIVTKQDLYL